MKTDIEILCDHLEEHSLSLESVEKTLWVLHGCLEDRDLSSEAGALFLTASTLSGLCARLEDDINTLYRMRKGHSDEKISGVAAGKVSS